MTHAYRFLTVGNSPYVTLHYKPYREAFKLLYSNRWKIIRTPGPKDFIEYYHGTAMNTLGTKIGEWGNHGEWNSPGKL